MNTRALAILGFLCATPALAEAPNNVTLVMENNAGMVTQVTGLTLRECKAVAALLSVADTHMPVYNTATASPSMGVYTLTTPGPKPVDSALRTAKCGELSDVKK